MAGARYIIGVDLGTTNTAVAYVDTQAADQRVTVFEVPQLVAPGELARRRQLPSFLYTAGEHDLSPAETALPWDDTRRRVVGELARAQGARMPGRMISSAKSWLCHAGVDRQAKILPWGAGADEGETTDHKLSPVEASSRILRHVEEAWDFAHRGEQGARFSEQEVMVTVPASFDEAARELTLEAAEMAGLERIRLLEEPQAAFYAWIDSHPAGSRAGLLAAGDRVLVFDIGGGTTDFTLISVGGDGDSFERTAVGDHLLLGGDNVDLTLAKQVETRLTEKTQKRLSPLQWHGLVHACRLAKERLLSEEEIVSVPVAVAGRGSRLVGGTLKDKVGRDELEHTMFDGFFPLCDPEETPSRARGGLQEFGLPFAPDPAVTRHLAHFLRRHQVERIDAVLFNGGAMTPGSLRRRVLEQIARWQRGDAPRELANETPELAVARGAAYYGLVRRGLGARIRGGTPRAFFVGVGAARGEQEEGGELAVCLAPKGLEEGSSVELERDFELVTNRPVSFKLYASSTAEEKPGALVKVTGEEELHELPPIVTVLRKRGRSSATVRLEVRITELGALEMWCHETGRDDRGERWRLSFDMRAGGAAREEEPQGGELDPKIVEAQGLLRAVFSGQSEIKVPRLMKALEETTDSRRDEWSMSATRALFDAALDVESAREKSPNHEARWLNLTGFCLRPGRGAPLDEWRVKQMWRIFNEWLVHPKHEQCRLAWWILWRRIAGGMSSGQQEQLFDRLAQLFLPSAKQKKKWYEVKPTKQEAAEMWRTLANMERLSTDAKQRLGDELSRRLESKKGRSDPVHIWALGRIGSRVPLYGPLNAVVPPHKVAHWIEPLLDAEWPDPEKATFPLAQLGRRTGDRSRDIDETLRKRLAERLRALPGGERPARLVEEIVSLEAREERVALGDSLPAGLRLVADDED